jgi:6-pyruvoyltetrahydropterin/6-carboxytetrahydropterin synthase
MYTVCVRDHFMIAPQFPGRDLRSRPTPARRNLRRRSGTAAVPELDPDGVVTDIGKLGDCLRVVLGDLNFRDLDQLPEFAGRNTTTEFLAREIFDRVAVRIEEGQLGPNAPVWSSMRITLHESHVAWASYEGTLS